MKNLLLLLLLCPFLLRAVSVQEVRAYAKGGDGQIVSNDFDGKKRWRKLPGYEKIPGEGANGTTALKLDRSQETPNRVVYTIALPGLVPGELYEVSVMVKSADIKPVKERPFRLTVCSVEFTKNGNTIAVERPTYIPSADYQQVKFTFTAKEGFGTQLALDLNSDYTGVVWYDDISVQSAGKDYSSRLVWPPNLTFRNGERNFRVHINDDAPENSVVLVSLEQNGQVQDVLLSKNALEGQFDALAVGNGKLTISLADPQAQKILAVNEYQVNVLPADTQAPANAATLDKHGRLIVDGKPFMPLGVYGLFHDANLRRIASAGFNCVLVYPSYFMYGEKKTGDKMVDIRAGLDAFAKYNLKLLFAMNQQLPGYNEGCTELDGVTGAVPVAAHTAKVFGSHPALLGYYISDEVSRHTIPHVQTLREALNAADPWHPTYTITYRMQDLPLYGITGDVIGVDSYPIQPDPKAEAKLDQIVTYMQGARSTGMPIWAIPQIFNWASQDVKTKYNTREKFLATRGPNAKEMLAMPMLYAILGAKGFIFFSEHGITLKAEMVCPGITEQIWPDVANMAREMKHLEPYILGIEPGPEVTVMGSDRVLARAFKAENGKFAVMIVAMGPCSAKATISLDLPKGVRLISRFGLTTGRDGLYEFAAEAIDYDVLEEQE